MAQQELNNNEVKGLLDLSDEELAKEIKVDQTIEGKDFKIDEETGEPVLSTQLADAITKLAEAAEKASVSFKDLSEISEEYKKIQEQFEKESNILNIDANTRFNVLSRDNDYTMLSYGEKDTIKVPNALVPFFANEQSVLCYKNGKFENA